MNVASDSTFAAPMGGALWRLAARQAWRDWRAGELRLLLLAVVLAVAALTAVGFFADRLQGGLQRDAAQLLGGDVVLSADRPLPPEFAQRANMAGLRSATSATFPSMARAGDAAGGAVKLVAVKAVSAGYPLRGALTLRDAAGGAGQRVAAAPEPGTVWVDEAVPDALGLALGDALWLGEKRLRVTRLIAVEPDRGAAFMGFAPRVLLSEADLPATGLVQPASRITYRLALAGAVGHENAVRQYAAWARATIEARQLRGVRVETLDSGRPEIRLTLDRAGKFLHLVALLAALLSAVAVAVAARDFAQRHLDDCAMLRVLGVSQRRMAGAFALQFIGLGLLAGAVGVALGWVAHEVFLQLLGAWLPAELPPPGPWPGLLGLGVGLTLLLGFGLPPVLQLARVPALRVIRRDAGEIKPASLAVWAAGAAAFAALLLAVARDLTLGAIAVGGFAAAVAVFGLLAWGAVALARIVSAHLSGPNWLLLALRQWTSRPALAVLQVAALAVGLMALALLVLLRTDLIDSWRQSTPADAPNRFVINIQPDQADDFQAALKQAGVARYDWYPMIRGRLLSINGASVTGRFDADERARQLVEREFNLSNAAHMPPHNRLAAGQWVAGQADALSVEKGLAETLGLKLGDRLAFDIAGQTRSGRITSLRELDWGSMRVNFFVMFPLDAMPAEPGSAGSPGADAGLPVTWIAAFRAPVQAGFDNRLAARFPNITSVDVTASIAQVQQVLDQVIRAVEYLFGFTLAAGLIVLLAAVGASREARAREYAVMRACGAGAGLLRRVQRVELLGAGALAGLLAAAAAMAVGWALARRVFEFNWAPAPWVPLAGTVAGALLAWAAGWWSLRGLLNRPVLHTLRRADQ